jgi:hypothetical protein
MIARRISRVLVLVGAAALAACSDPVPRPIEQAQPVERPVITLRGELPTRVPRAALVERAGITGVYVLDGGLARFRMIKPGGTLGANEVEILSGLTGSETIVLGELVSLYDGRPIRKQ